MRLGLINRMDQVNLQSRQTPRRLFLFVVADGLFGSSSFTDEYDILRTNAKMREDSYIDLACGSSWNPEIC